MVHVFQHVMVRFDNDDVDLVVVIIVVISVRSIAHCYYLEDKANIDDDDDDDDISIENERSRGENSILRVRNYQVLSYFFLFGETIRTNKVKY